METRKKCEEENSNKRDIREIFEVQVCFGVCKYWRKENRS